MPIRRSAVWYSSGTARAFDELLRKNGATPDAVAAILAAFGVKHGEQAATEGQKIILEFADGEIPTSAAASPGSRSMRRSIARRGRGQRRRAICVGRRQAAASKPAQRQSVDNNDEEGGLSLYQSLYQTALKQGLPKPVIEEFVHAFVNDVDFQRSAQPGDSMTAFIADPDEFEPHPTLLYATMTVRDQTYRYYRFQTPDDNLVDFMTRTADRPANSCSASRSPTAR